MDNVWFIAAAWMGMALVASVISIRLGISVALVEIAVGIIGGNFLHFQTTTCPSCSMTFLLKILLQGHKPFPFHLSPRE